MYECMFWATYFVQVFPADGDRDGDYRDDGYCDDADDDDRDDWVFDDGDLRHQLRFCQ